MIIIMIIIIIIREKLISGHVKWLNCHINRLSLVKA